MTMSNQVFVFGSGGHSKSLVSALIRLGQDESGIVLVDDNPSLGKNVPNVIPESVACSDVSKQVSKNFCGFVGTDLKIRKVKILKLEDLGIKFSGFITGSTISGYNSSIHATTQVFESTYVGPSAIIGKHCVINTRSTIEHECEVGDFSHISVGAVLLGNSKVGSHVFIGAGAIVLPGVIVGDGATVGAGAVVTENVEADATVAGNPARVITK